MSRILFDFFDTTYSDADLVGAPPVVFAPRIVAFVDVPLLTPRAVFAPSGAAETLPSFIDPGVVGPGSAVFAPRIIFSLNPDQGFNGKIRTRSARGGYARAYLLAA